ncbi:Hypothetical protein R9X50_00206900 [Acrodontium crateriforme]|uniref:Peroxin/Ferlin domain-containing protein n=1 Tax=Acrodontium crateriforme TaxID=150365 RepID=A0AAQ3M0J7_9PEZI|nr:Hypothetical protein R9X50_00206900 [Acrodontium crateriforme]
MRLRKKLTSVIRHLDTPWTHSSSSMSHHRQSSQPEGPFGNDPYGPPTTAPFSPDQHVVSHRTPASILIHQKSPLLVATPPQVTRVLASSHPFILPLNHFVGLLSWTTGDPWESLLLVAGFWLTVLYADYVLSLAAPVVLVVGLIAGMYWRRFSPLSSTVWSGQKARHKRSQSEQQRKSLDEILDTLHTFTARCDVLMDPFFRLTEFLSTQSSATSTTTRPALTNLFVRILVCTPLWVLLALPPWRIITTSRLILVAGTIALTWHSRPARVSRTLLWRSRVVRVFVSFLTGLDLVPPVQITSLTHSQSSTSLASVLKSKTKLKELADGPNIRFTFTIHENQRRWLGLGWTSSLLAYERQAWTDEQLNPSPAPSDFTLPVSDLAAAKWRWVPGSEWKVAGAEKETEKEKSARRIGGGGGGDGMGWTYFDTKWQEGRKVDGWGRYTRSRKWIRDAELVDVKEADEDGTQNSSSSSAAGKNLDNSAELSSAIESTPSNTTRRKGWFSRAGQQRPVSVDLKSDSASATGSTGRSSMLSREDEDERDVLETSRFGGREWDRSFGDGVAEGLG